jgi:hypothetical protein
MTRIYVTAMVGLGAAAWAFVLALYGWELSPSFFKPFSVVVGVVLAGALVFEAFIWRLPGINALVKRPDLRGTWKGALRSNWRDPQTGVSRGPIEAYVVIRQSYSTAHVRLMTAESQSFSLAASVGPEAEEQYILTWVYRNDPAHSVRERSAPHFGGGFVRIGGPPPNSMAGHYWTDRNAAGEIEFQRCSRECANDFLTAQRLGAALVASGPSLKKPA